MSTKIRWLGGKAGVGYVADHTRRGMERTVQTAAGMT